METAIIIAAAAAAAAAIIAAAAGAGAAAPVSADPGIEDKQILCIQNHHMPPDTFCRDTLIPTVCCTLLKNAVLGIDHYVHTTKENPYVKGIPEGLMLVHVGSQN